MEGNWLTRRTTSPSLTVEGVKDGNYEIEVVAIDALGNRSVTTSSRRTIDRGLSGVVQGVAAGIEPVQGAALSALSLTQALLTWTPPRTRLLRLAIRHTPDSSAGDWGGATTIIPETIDAAAGQAAVPALSGTYLLRFFNARGQGSGSLAAVQFAQSPTYSVATAAAYAESVGGFGGTKTNCFFDTSTNTLRLSRSYFDGMGLIDSLSTLIDDYGAVTSSSARMDDYAVSGDWDAFIANAIDTYGADNRIAVYDFSTQLDLGAIYDVELTRLIQSYSLALPVTWDGIAGLVDDAVDIDGEITNGGTIRVEFSSSTDAPSGAKWSEWAPLVHCYSALRSLRLRAVLAIDDVNQDVAAQELGATVVLPQRVEASSTLTSGAGTFSVTFPTAFYAAPAVGVTPLDLATGDYFQVASVTATGFSVTFRNSAGTAVSRNFQYQATGFGRRTA